MTEEQVENAAPVLPPLIAQVARGERLTTADAEAAFGEIMEGRASLVQIAALLVGMRTRGETPGEVAGGVRALRRAMVPVPVNADDPRPLVDTCGTGGGASTFNISTAAAILAAGAGVRIAKHGNRSFSSRSGSADVLEALGVEITLTPEAMGRVLDEAGIVFMFAPLLHPAMRHVAPVRKELAIPTVMNLLGPLTNPAGARRQVVGVPDTSRLELLAAALAELGHERALVVHGHPDMDELSPIGPTEMVELKDGQLTRSTFDPVASLGWEGLSLDALPGGEPEENAATVKGVLDGRIGGAPRAAVTLNAGAAIYLSGIADSLVAGVLAAESAIDEGKGAAALERLRAASRAAAQS